MLLHNCRNSTKLSINECRWWNRFIVDTGVLVGVLYIRCFVVFYLLKIGQGGVEECCVFLKLFLPFFATVTESEEKDDLVWYEDEDDVVVLVIIISLWLIVNRKCYASLKATLGEELISLSFYSLSLHDLLVFSTKNVLKLWGFFSFEAS